MNAEHFKQVRAFWRSIAVASLVVSMIFLLDSIWRNV